MLEAASGREIKQYCHGGALFKAPGVQHGCDKVLGCGCRQTASAVFASADAGNEVAFAKGASFIRHIEAGEKTHLRSERGTYRMEVGVVAVAVMRTGSGDDSRLTGQAQVASWRDACWRFSRKP